MSQSRTVHTRRRRQKGKKQLARTAKQQKKVRNQNAKGAVQKAPAVT